MHRVCWRLNVWPSQCATATRAQLTTALYFLLNQDDIISLTDEILPPLNAVFISHVFAGMLFRGPAIWIEEWDRKPMGFVR